MPNTITYYSIACRLSFLLSYRSHERNVIEIFNFDNFCIYLSFRLFVCVVELSKYNSSKWIFSELVMLSIPFGTGIERERIVCENKTLNVN